MTSITISNLDEALEQKLRARAIERNHSIEDEARELLCRALTDEAAKPDNLADNIRRLVEPFGGFDIPPFPRGPMREPPDFS
jgi:plasmid stability protein